MVIGERRTPVNYSGSVGFAQRHLYYAATPVPAARATGVSGDCCSLRWAGALRRGDVAQLEVQRGLYGLGESRVEPSAPSAMP